MAMQLLSTIDARYTTPFEVTVRSALLWTLGELRGYWSADRLAAIEGSSEVERDRQRFVDGAREPIRKNW